MERASHLVAEDTFKVVSGFASLHSALRALRSHVRAWLALPLLCKLTEYLSPCGRKTGRLVARCLLPSTLFEAAGPVYPPSTGLGTADL